MENGQGLGVIIFSFYFLFKPPKKHKEFSLHDRDEATIRALGGSGAPDLTKLEPEVKEQKKKH